LNQTYFPLYWTDKLFSINTGAVMGGKGCNSLIRAEKILTYIAYVGAASFMELLREFQYPKSSLLNLLNVMVDCGFLTKSDRNQYSLGIKNYELGCQALHRKIFLR
jgi:DNA-binding IclR family transcriptional regulator